MEFSKVALTFESEDKILWSDHDQTKFLYLYFHMELFVFAICLSHFAFDHIWQ